MKAVISFIISFLFASTLAAGATQKPVSPSERAFNKANAEYYRERYPEALNLYIEAMDLAAKEGNDQVDRKSVV